MFVFNADSNLCRLSFFVVAAFSKDRDILFPFHFSERFGNRQGITWPVYLYCDYD